MSRFRSQIRSTPARVIPECRRCPGGHEYIGDLLIAGMCGAHQRCKAACLTRIGIRSRLQQAIHDGGVAGRGRAVQRRDADVIGACRARIGTTIEKLLNGAVRGEESCVM